MFFRYKNIVIGGTFDCLHIGHKNLIDKAFKAAGFVTIGLTSDRFNLRREKTTWGNQQTRKSALVDYLKNKGYSERSSIILINDIFGTSVTDPKLEAIITTKETLKNVRKINIKRVRKGLKKLEIVMVNHIKDTSGKIISSSRIRNGEISPNGENYQNLLLKIAGQRLNTKILNKFKAPLGKIIHVIRQRRIHTITVGDITTRKFLEHGITPKLSIIDLKTKRGVVIPGLFEPEPQSRRPGGAWESFSKVKNPAGMISKNLIFTLEKAINRKNDHIILVEGEEDLATIPAVLLSPFGAGVYYGQPSKGIVEVIVNQQIKDKICTKF